nr:putative ribonuclease H-like domain-containing protein [Tanacetum cinerariifolium]
MFSLTKAKEIEGLFEFLGLVQSTLFGFSFTNPLALILISLPHQLRVNHVFLLLFKLSNEVNATGTIVLTVGQNSSNGTNPFSAAGPSNTTASPTYGKSLFIDASQLFDDPDMPEVKDITYSDDENDEKPKRKLWVLVDLPHEKRAIGTKWVFKNKKDERGIVVRNKARLVTQGHTQEEGIDYEEVFAVVARIEAIRLFLAYASFMGFMVYQMDIKSAFLYRTIEEEVYVCQPSGFEDPDHPDKVYKVVKALYGLHQAPRA